MAQEQSTIRVSTFDGPGAKAQIREVPWPKVGRKGALIKVAACGVCGTDLHILKGHWPKPLPWPFTLGHEISGVVVEIGPDLKTDWMDQPIGEGSKIMIPPFMPCGDCYYCKHYPEHSQSAARRRSITGAISDSTKAGASVGRLGGICLCGSRDAAGTKIYKLPDAMSRGLEPCGADHLDHTRLSRGPSAMGGFKWGDTVVIQGSGPIGIPGLCRQRRRWGPAR